MLETRYYSGHNSVPPPAKGEVRRCDGSRGYRVFNLGDFRRFKQVYPTLTLPFAGEGTVSFETSTKYKNDKVSI